MTRDEEGGRYVNLIPSIYRLPTEAEAGAIRDIIGAPYEESDNAHQVGDDFYKRVAYRVWQDYPDLLETPFARKYVKRPAMSYFYGARAGGFAKDKKGEWQPFGMTEQVIDAGYTGPAKKLAEAIFNCIEKMLPRPKAVRDWLEKHAQSTAKPLRWTTPLGLPVINIYQSPQIKNHSVLVNGRRRSVKLVIGDKDGINKEKAANSITANFVHSADAAHLQLVALVAAESGINMVSVHDCFGTIAPDAAPK